MKKFGRRTLAVLIGLILGWMAAGMVNHGTPGAVVVHASDPAHAEGDHAEGNLDAGQRGAAELVPTPEQIPFYRNVVYLAGGLFALALVVGVISRSFGLKDPGVAAIEHDLEAAHHDHDDHAHGDAGHAHH